MKTVVRDADFVYNCLVAFYQTSATNTTETYISATFTATVERIYGLADFSCAGAQQQ
jgi:hypothetical protein